MTKTQLYVQGEITCDKLERILRASIRLGASQFVLWPHSDELEEDFLRLVRAVSPFQQDRRAVERVTTYYDDTERTKAADLYELSEDAIKVLGRLDCYPLNEVLDDLATYLPDGPDWVTCMIFHERMALVRQREGVERALKEEGIAFSVSKPAWW